MNFIEDNREEIEQCAYNLWQIRKRNSQSDATEENWHRAIEIVRERIKNNVFRRN